jgi:hypothetical protein
MAFSDMTYAQQFAAIIEQIEPILKEGLDPERYAAAMIEEIEDEDGHFEVRGLHTRSGNPHAFSL